MTPFAFRIAIPSLSPRFSAPFAISDHCLFLLEDLARCVCLFASLGRHGITYARRPNRDLPLMLCARFFPPPVVCRLIRVVCLFALMCPILTIASKKRNGEPLCFGSPLASNSVCYGRSSLDVL
jgi:hypothetical protein